ncbi:MAG: hypothetical protein OCD02_02845 [Spirochaetaceae bacterium]
MSNQVVVIIAIKLVIGFLATIISLLLWSKTRDVAWLTMVLGVIFLYLETLLEILESFGLVLYKSLQYGDIEILPFVFGTLPFIFFGTGMLLFLLRIRKF